jgi:hypothetical protein
VNRTSVSPPELTCLTAIGEGSNAPLLNGSRSPFLSRTTGFFDDVCVPVLMNW